VVDSGDLSMEEESVPVRPPEVPWSRRFRFVDPSQARPMSPHGSRATKKRTSSAPARVPEPRVPTRGPASLTTTGPPDPEVLEAYPPEVDGDLGESTDDVFEPSPSPHFAQTTQQAERLRELRSSVIDEDWGAAYRASPFWAADWELVNTPGPEWPKGMKIFGDKMYRDEKLCVPESFVHRVVREHHEATGHVVGKKFLTELSRRYIFPPTADARTWADLVRRECLVCQACEPPTFAVREEVHMTPVPDRFMASVCLDIFSMPPATWLGESFDCYLLCVDRLTGWMIARPTTKQGLTGEKAAHLLMDSSWGEVGLPSIVTSDQGTQFTSQWFHTMCLRLGIRMAFSQAHRPQANGRAEVCGRILQLSLRKMHFDEGINWVEALPRALRLHHDMAGDFNVSPYEMVFGRERNLAGIPWQPVRECMEVQDFLKHMEAMDRKVAQALNDAHDKIQKRVNNKRKAKAPFEDGDWVWLMSPKKVGGQKIERWWKGPFQVVQRTGEASFQIRTDKSVMYDVHRDQLKPCIWDMGLGDSYPLVFRAADASDQRPTAPVVDRILEHRSHPIHGLEFLTHWITRERDFTAWESAGSFLHNCPDPWLGYCKKHSLILDLPQVVDSIGRVPDIVSEPEVVE
jgi:hypothetical protein